jgi:hypothetical protein
MARFAASRSAPPSGRGPVGMRTKLLASITLLAAVVTTLAGVSTWSAFSGSTADAGNTFAAGTVAISDNDGGSAMFAFTGVRPGDTDAKCLTVTYTGTLPSLVRLHGATTGSGLDQYVDMEITRGTISSGAYPSCTGFAADGTDWIGQGAGVIYRGTLAAFGDDWAAGTADPKAAVPEAWTTGEVHAYKVQLTLQDNQSAMGKSFSQTLTWEARNTTAYSQVVMSDGPVGYWKLDEAAGTSASDSAGANPGTYVNGTLVGQSSGVKDGGYAAVFDASNDYINVGDVFGFAGNLPFSVELWFQRNTANEGINRQLASKEHFVGSLDRSGWVLYISADSDVTPERFTFQRREGAASYRTARSSTTIDPGVWYHAVVTYDGTNMRVYLNGVLEHNVSAPNPLPAHAQPLRFGSRAPALGSLYGGGLDEVAIYDRALTAAQALAHYNAGRR